MPVDLLASRYDRAAPAWDGKLTRLGYHAAYDELVTSADLARGCSRVLDAGCGSGAFAAALNRHCDIGQIDLLDCSQNMLGEARQRLEMSGASVGFCYGALFDDAVPQARYDVVLAGHLVEHTADPATTVHWLLRRLKPDGTLLLAVSRPHWCTALIRMIWGHKAYPPETVLGWAPDLESRAVSFSSGPPSRTSTGYVFHLSKNTLG